MLDPSNKLDLTLLGPPAAKLLIPKGSLTADLGPRFSTGAAVEGGGAEKGLVDGELVVVELIGFPDTLLGSLGARVGGGARRAGTAAGA